jgi:hypothetical protein
MVEDEEEVEPRTPGSLDLGNHGNGGDGGVCEAGAGRRGTVDPFYAVSILGILWRQMQLICWCGQLEGQLCIPVI